MAKKAKKSVKKVVKKKSGRRPFTKEDIKALKGAFQGSNARR